MPDAVDRLPRTRHWRDHALWSFVATLFLTGIMRVAQAGGLTRIDLPLVLGTLMTPDRDRAKVLGTVVHLLNGWLFGGIYVAAFHSLRRSSAAVGAAVGLVHGLFVLVVALPLLPGGHSRMASDFTGPQPTTALEPPGFMALNYGRSTPLVALGAHLVYGAILGHFYEVTGLERRWLRGRRLRNAPAALRQDLVALGSRNR